MTEFTETLSEKADALLEHAPEYTHGDSLEYDGVVAEYGEHDEDLDDGLPPAEYIAETPAQQVVAGMERLAVQDFLGDTVTREAVRSSIDVEAYKQTLDAVNGTARGLPQEEWGMDGSGYIEFEGALFGSVKSYDPPAEHDRVPLLEKAIEASKGLPAEHSGTLKGLAIHATHVYDDGCGRTSRWAYLADTHGYDGSEADRQLYENALSETSGRTTVNLDQSYANLPGAYAQRECDAIAARYDYRGTMPQALIGGYGTAMGGEESVAMLDAHPDLSPEDRFTLHHIIADLNNGSNVIAEHLLKTGRAAEYISTSEESGRAAVDMDSLVPKLTAEDVQAMDQSHSAMKRRYVEDLIDTFVNPDRADEAQQLVAFYRPTAA